MGNKEWEDFPALSVVGRNFTLYEQYAHQTEGRIARVALDLEKGNVEFFSHGMPDRPVASCATSWGSWRREEEGGVTVHIPMIGTLIIDPE